MGTLQHCFPHISEVHQIQDVNLRQRCTVDTSLKLKLGLKHHFLTVSCPEFDPL